MNTPHAQSDDRPVQQDVIDELAWSPEVDESGIGVAVVDGAVTLSGEVDTYSQRHAAVRAAIRVAGVRLVVDELSVRHGVAHEQNDAELAGLVTTVLESSIRVPDGAVTAHVRHGVVTLTGTVKYEYQRRAAAKSVGAVAGVTAVENRISLVERASETDTQKLITRALVRHALLDAEAIHVTAVGTEVTLTGSVPTVLERQEAVRAAWNSPHVTEVHDKIIVTG